MKAPTSRRGARTLPLDAADVAALQALHDRQVAEVMEARDAYGSSGYVVCDELGEAVNPEWYSDEWRQLAGGRRRRTGAHPGRLAWSHRHRQQAELHPRTARGHGGRTRGAKQDQ